MAVKVKLRIKATVTDLVLAERYAASVIDGRCSADDGVWYPAERLDELCSDVIEYTVWGSFSEENGACMLRYTETPDIGYDECVTTLVFSAEDRGRLLMSRDGEISTACCFDVRERRQCCRYETPILPMEFTVNTRAVHNTVAAGSGAILLDYNIEVRGVNTERNRLFIEVRRYDGE